MPRGILALTLVLGMIPNFAAQIEQGIDRYFAETGHSIDPRFIASFEALGGAPILGFPITESFHDETGRLVQYFENALLELSPDAEGEDLSAAAAPLGVILGGWDLPLQRDKLPFGSSAGCRFYSETGHQVCHAFLDFYDAQGGPDTFGHPITEFRIEQGRIVQYFERLRMDWYPEAEAGARIKLGPLGREHFDFVGHDPSLLHPIPAPEGERYPVSELRSTPSVWKPLLAPGETQQVYLVVSDQHMRPIQGAAVLLTVYLDDELRMQMLPLTDERGICQATLTFPDAVPGTPVVLEFVVLYQGLAALTRDSFYLWY